MGKKPTLDDFREHTIVRKDYHQKSKGTAILVDCMECGGEGKAEILQTATENEILYHCYKCKASNGRSTTNPARNFNELYRTILKGENPRKAAPRATAKVQPPTATAGAVTNEDKWYYFNAGEETYIYTDINGKHVYYRDKCVRIVDGEREKAYPYYVSKNIDSSGRVYRKGGMGNSKIKLYNLQSIYEASKDEEKNQVLYIVEGEKCVNAMTKLGLSATTTPTGGGNKNLKLTQQEADIIKSYQFLVIIPDNDKVGHELPQSYSPYHDNIIILDMLELWKDAPPKGDIADFIEVEPLQVITRKIVDKVAEKVGKQEFYQPPAPQTDTNVQSANPSQGLSPDFDEVRAAQLAEIKDAITAGDDDLQSNSIIPDVLNPLRQAEKFMMVYGDRIINTTATGWIVYTKTSEGGGVWKIQGKGGQGARNLYYDFVKLQKSAWRKEKAVSTAHPKDILAREKSIIGMESRGALVLDEVRHMTEKDFCLLDKNPYILNTPKGIINLKTGDYLNPDEARKEYCTKITAVSPSNEGAGIWNKFVDDFTVKDKALAKYLQLLAGEILVGEVKQEHLIIAYDQRGRNGKSTFFNALMGVLNDYAGIFPSTLIIRSTFQKDNNSDVADLQGKRLAILKELAGNEKLSERGLKDYFSTDKIHACRKFMEPFDFVPSHTGVLYTNALPAIMSNDGGTTRRLQVLPCKAYFPKDKAIENYCGYLIEKAGGAILKWCIEGARAFIKNNFKIDPPMAVEQATAEYLEEYDYIKAFLEERTLQDDKEKTSSKFLYDKYCIWCDVLKQKHKRNVPIMNQREFRNQLEQKGYVCKREKTGMFWQGIKLLPEYNIGYMGDESIEEAQSIFA